MKKGEVYKVFEDPLTKQRLEGHATIIEVEDAQTFLEIGYHYCIVRFDDDSEDSRIRRKIDEKDIVK